MLLVFIALGLEVYQVVAHVHCLAGRTLPASHRSTVGFGAAISGDALSYLLSGIGLYVSGGPWALLLLPLLGHVFYLCLLVFFRPFYVRIHDFSQQTIYTDRSFVRAKTVAGVFDASFHLLAVVLLARYAPAAETVSLAALGVVGYFFVFNPGAFEAGARKPRSSAVTTRVVQDKHA
jgi:hypothetical protein